MQYILILKSSQSPEWEEIIMSAIQQDIQNINNNPALAENGIWIKMIQRGCLEVIFNISSGGAPFENKIRSLMHVLFEVLDIESILQKNNISKFQVEGYVDFKEEFKGKQKLPCICILGPEKKIFTVYTVFEFPISVASKEVADEMSIIRHISWKNSETNYDIDVYISDWMKHLLQQDFSTKGKMFA